MERYPSTAILVCACLALTATIGSAADSKHLIDKTLVVWAAPANLTQQGGGVLTLENPANVFDAVVFGELSPGRWMAGSDRWRRTEKRQGHYPAETADATTTVQIALVYRGRNVVIYRNGKPYARHAMATDPVTFSTKSTVLMGRRHITAGGSCYFGGAVDDVRIYPAALTAGQIAALRPNQPSDPKPLAWWDFEAGKAEDKMKTFPPAKLLGGAKITGGKLHLDGRSGYLVTPRGAAGRIRPAPYRSPIHFMPSRRAVGDVMPFYWKGEYHVFFLTNPTGNHDVHWEHCVSRDLVNWKQLPPALAPDNTDPTGPEGGCMFTGCVVEAGGVFHAWYTSWNRRNPKGREYLSHATSRDLVKWTKHPEHMIAPDGVHFANHRNRDFRDPQIFWNDKAAEYWMHVLANVPGKKGVHFGLLTSKDLVKWKQVGTVAGVPGDECPDYFRIGDTHYIHSCRRYCYSDKLAGPYRYPKLTNELDMPCIIAAKRVWDGKRHVWFGGWRTGGPMAMPREVYAGPDGLLYMKPVDEVLGVFKHTVGDLTKKAKLAKPGAAALFDVPDNYMLDCRVKLTRESRFTIAMRRQHATGDAYRLTLLPGKGQLSLVGPGIKRTRPCPIEPSKPVKIQAFVQGGLIECFVNDQFAQTCRASRHTGGKLALSLDGGKAEVVKLLVKTHQAAAAAKPPRDDVYSRGAPGTYTVPPELKDFRLLSSTPMKLGNAKAVGHDPRKWQSDPSRIIFHGGKYHFWMIDGYNHSIRKIPKNGKSWILYVSSKDGRDWKAVDYVPLGPKGSCYDLAIEQANVLHHKGRFYLFSLGFTTNIRKYGRRYAGIFCLTADKPEGPWRQVGGVLVAPSRDGKSFDTDGVVNPRHVFFKGKWFMYYKGVKRGEPTDNGVAIADSLTGPYKKYEGNPLLFGHGHFAWRYKHGIIMVNFDAWYEKNYVRILWTQDGLHFVPLIESKGTFLFGSLYCPYDPLCGEPVTDKPTTKYWGLQSVYYRGRTGWDVERIEWKFGPNRAE